MVGMDQVVCRECAEVVFIHDSMACGRLVLHFRPGGSLWGSSKVLSPQITRNYQKWTNIVVRSFAPQETLLEPPRWLVWTKWYVKSVSKCFYRCLVTCTSIFSENFMETANRTTDATKLKMSGIAKLANVIEIIYAPSSYSPTNPIKNGKI